MLQVGVHDRDIAGLAREHALEASAGEAAAADAADAAHAAVGLADGAGGGGGAIGRIIVDENDFPIARGEHVGEPLDQERNVGPLVEGRHDDGEFRRRTQRRELFGACRRNRRNC